MSKEIAFYDFTLLPENDQFSIVFSKGEFIAFREIRNSRFVLYKLYSFFVEIEYDVLKNVIVGKVILQNK